MRAQHSIDIFVSHAGQFNLTLLQYNLKKKKCLILLYAKVGFGCRHRIIENID